MKQHIKIFSGYNIWHPAIMKVLIDGHLQPHKASTYLPYIIEWWLHNIGYYLTKPFTFIPALKRINLRCKDVDLIVRVKE
jgi:hypothetical protein